MYSFLIQLRLTNSPLSLPVSSLLAWPEAQTCVPAIAEGPQPMPLRSATVGLLRPALSAYSARWHSLRSEQRDGSIYFNPAQKTQAKTRHDPGRIFSGIPHHTGTCHDDSSINQKTLLCKQPARRVKPWAGMGVEVRPPSPRNGPQPSLASHWLAYGRSRERPPQRTAPCSGRLFPARH